MKSAGNRSLLLRNAKGDMAAAQAPARALERDKKVNVIPADRDAKLYRATLAHQWRWAVA